MNRKINQCKIKKLQSIRNKNEEERLFQMRMKSVREQYKFLKEKEKEIEQNAEEKFPHWDKEEFDLPYPGFPSYDEWCRKHRWQNLFEVFKIVFIFSIISITIINTMNYFYPIGSSKPTTEIIDNKGVK